MLEIFSVARNPIVYKFVLHEYDELFSLRSTTDYCMMMALRSPKLHVNYFTNFTFRVR